jgi:hypothetical protein
MVILVIEQTTSGLHAGGTVSGESLNPIYICDMASTNVCNTSMGDSFRRQQSHKSYEYVALLLKLPQSAQKDMLISYSSREGL